MSDTWSILLKELAFHGFRLGGGGCQFHKSDGSMGQLGLKECRDMLKSEIKENLGLFTQVWSEVANLLMEQGAPSSAVDEKTIDLFIFSLKDLVKFIDCFDGQGLAVKHILKASLERDVNSFTDNQLKRLPDYKLAIDWLHRLASRQAYVCRLIEFVSTGKSSVNSLQIKTAKGISGPWANLDLPIRERMWEWEEEDSNLRGRDADIRGQDRYTKGLDNYNNDGRVGEGHYWRELRNEPFEWADREEGDPYPHRNILQRP